MNLRPYDHAATTCRESSSASVTGYAPRCAAPSLKCCHAPPHAGRVVLLAAMIIATMTGGMWSGCAIDVPPLNPFTDLPVIDLDGSPHELTADLSPLGEYAIGEGFRVRVDGDAIRSVRILIADTETNEAGVIAGGGPVGTSFDYPVLEAGRYFAFIRFDESTNQADRTGTITAERLSASDVALLEPPAEGQVVQVIFEEGFLTEPGLWDPDDGTQEEREFLADISDLVRGEVLGRLKATFAHTPIQIIGEGDDPPDGPVSRLTFTPDRVLAEDQDVFDAALPPPDPDFPECQVRVIFGSVLPAGSQEDIGNSDPEDEAVVNIGSFQGRGPSCRTAVTNSINNIVFAIAQTGAHEIGHLVGLAHVGQIDIMNASATLAFFRDLEFARGQVQFDRFINGEVVSDILTTVIQDPQIYFRAIFAPPLD